MAADQPLSTPSIVHIATNDWINSASARYVGPRRIANQYPLFVTSPQLSPTCVGVQVPPAISEALMSTPQQTVDTLAQEWASDPRWRGVRRDYGPEDVLRLRTVVQPEPTLAGHGARRLWDLLGERDHVRALGALTGGQAVQMVKAGLEAIYLSGWQV